jgi:TolB-like protein
VPAATTSEEPTKPCLSLPDKPSIAVLAFTNMSANPDQEYIADGIVDDIDTELSRFSKLFVIARNSSFQYKSKAVDVRQVGSMNPVCVTCWRAAYGAEAIALRRPGWPCWSSR